MRLRLSFLLFAVCISFFVFAQTTYGFKAGVNMSNQYKKINPPGYSIEKIDTKILPGFQVGAFIKQQLSKDLKLAAEFNFSAIGSKTKYNRTDFVVNPDGSVTGATTGFYNDKIQQLEIPLLLQYNLHQFYIGLGPAVGLKLSSKINNFQNTSFKNDSYKPVDISACAVIGCTVYKKTDFNLRYSYAFTDIDKRDYSLVKNRVLNFSVLYRLN